MDRLVGWVASYSTLQLNINVSVIWICTSTHTREKSCHTKKCIIKTLSIFMSRWADHSSIWQCVYSDWWQPGLNPLDHWTWPQRHLSSMVMLGLLMCWRYTWLHLSFLSPVFFCFYSTVGIWHLRKCLMRETERSRKRLRRCTHSTHPLVRWTDSHTIVAPESK